MIQRSIHLKKKYELYFQAIIRYIVYYQLQFICRPCEEQPDWPAAPEADLNESLVKDGRERRERVCYVE